MDISEILNVAETVFVPEGKKKSKWSGSDEFEQFAEKHAKNDVCFGFGDKEGVTLETPFGADSALIRFQTDQQRPQLGYGLLITTQIRTFQRFENACAEAAGLNFFESRFWTNFPQLDVGTLKRLRKTKLTGPIPVLFRTPCSCPA